MSKLKATLDNAVRDDGKWQLVMETPDGTVEWVDRRPHILIQKLELWATSRNVTVAVDFLTNIGVKL